MKGSVEMFFSIHSVHVHGCSDELLVIYRAIAVGVSLYLNYTPIIQTTN